MAHLAWEHLPSVIIVEILSYLPVTDKFRSTSACKRWRNCLFQPALWRKVDFRFKYGWRKQARFLTDVIGRFVKEASIEFNSRFYADIRDCLVLLKEFSKNGNLEKLVVKPISFQVSWPEQSQEIGRLYQENTLDAYLDAIDDIIENSRHLRQLSLGCIPEFTDHAETIIELLERKQHRNIESLSIASVKEDPEEYGLLDLAGNPFSCFQNLHTLSLDYDYLTSDLLSQFFSVKGKVPLEKLIIHVHGMMPGHEKIPNMVWDRLVKANPKLAVTLSLVHSFDGTANLSDILRPAMPIVHFRMLFCMGINVSSLNFISRFMGGRLESVCIMDGLDGGVPMMYDFVADEDPFVMMAWKCPNLKHFTLIGYDISMENIIAMARLRGRQLETFFIPSCCISIMDESEEEAPANLQADEGRLLNEISGSLGRPWQPMADEDLPPAVLDPLADAETAYLDLLLKDQA